MRLNSRLKTIGSLGLFITALLMLTFLEACNRFDKDDANRQPQMKKGPAEISVENGEAVLALDTATQGRLGLQVVTLTPTVTRPQITSPPLVLPIQNLPTSRTRS